MQSDDMKSGSIEQLLKEFDALCDQILANLAQLIEWADDFERNRAHASWLRESEEYQRDE